jgi:hypothetical protein
MFAYVESGSLKQSHAFVIGTSDSLETLQILLHILLQKSNKANYLMVTT